MFNVKGHWWLVAVVLFALSGCASTQYRVATAPGNGFANLLNLSPESITIQAPCAAGVSRATKTVPVSCVFIETSDRLHFLKYQEATQTYVPAVSIDIKEIAGIAFVRAGLNRQIQLRRGDELMAFHIVGAELVDTKTTALIYERLVKAGAPEMTPEKWVDLIGPLPVTIPIYVGG